MFTDGACRGNPGPGGWAVLIRAGSREKELSGGEPLTTNNRMELLAAISALEALTRLVDWLNVPPGALVKPKDPREYLDKLRFHTRVKSARDYGYSA